MSFGSASIKLSSFREQVDGLFQLIHRGRSKMRPRAPRHDHAKYDLRTSNIVSVNTWSHGKGKKGIPQRKKRTSTYSKTSNTSPDGSRTAP